MEGCVACARELLCRSVSRHWTLWSLGEGRAVAKLVVIFRAFSNINILSLKSN